MKLLKNKKHCIRIADEKVALATLAYDLVWKPLSVVLHEMLILNDYASTFIFITGAISW